MAKRWTTALALLGLAMGLSACTAPSAEDKKALEGGFASYSQRNYAAAEKAAGTYIGKFPDDTFVDEAFYLRGVARQAKGDQAGAEKDLATAIAKTDRADLKAKANRALGDAAYEA